MMKIYKKIISLLFFVVIVLSSLALVQADYVKYEEVNLSASVEKLVNNKLDSYYEKISTKSL